MIGKHMNYSILIQRLNAPRKEDRLDALRKIKLLLDNGQIDIEPRSNITNNHIHTKYSFSPYSPTSAVWHGYKAGLASIGIIDHDSLAGAKEFIEAGKIIGIPTTIGYETRTDWSDTKLLDKRINNTDQISSAYVTTHGVPHDKIDEVERFLKPIRAARNERNKKEIIKINEITSPFGITLDFEKDVLPISYAHDGGTITERHLLFALTKKMIQIIGKGSRLINFFQHKLAIILTKRQTEYLLEVDCDMYEYDVLNILKGSFVKKIYIDTNKKEAIPVDDTVKFAKSINAIASYCYLGDVDKSPTGDKKAQKFEDSYLEEVMEECTRIGFDAVSFMPSRNTSEQLDRLMKLCDKYGFMQISGEDINQPRQKFLCKQLEQEEYSHLIDTTWALIGHEIATSKNARNAMFKKARPDKQGIEKLILKYQEIGKKV